MDTHTQDIKSKIEHNIKLILDIVMEQVKERKKKALEMHFLQDSFSFTLSEERKKFHKRVNEIKEEYDTINEDLEKNIRSLKKLKQKKRRLEKVSILPPRKRKPVNYREASNREIEFGIISRSASDNRQW